MGRTTQIGSPNRYTPLIFVEECTACWPFFFKALTPDDVGPTHGKLGHHYCVVPEAFRDKP